MNNLKIPPQYKVGIRLIIKTDETVFNKLLNVITEINPSVDINSLTLEISPKIQEISINDLQNILLTIRSLYTLRNRESLKKNEIITGLINAVSTDEIFSDLSAEELTVFEYRLHQLFAIDGCISISSEAITLLQEYEHIFSSSRIVTDVRPIFKTEKKEGIAGALVVHTLRIAYQDATGIKEFYVALDSNDVKNLYEQLSQSLIEADIIQTMLNKANVLYLEPNSSST